ncbi:Rossmann-like domain-containing protein [Streptomyces oceani]|uniref:Putative heavy-metal chelation domain-containing protein n=1 Tax=Streptomyces oceani TaxID=1075402 RepID=A0A1E7KK74_9ACTN|nr:DUF364 domain-containing protein [Streptomyces oceani]OEV04313.1 hypothetical protein AN216_09045 [Streptomyces oceani]
MSPSPPSTVAELTEAVLAGQHGPAPSTMTVTSAFWLHHTTRLTGGDVTYRNHYLLLRTGAAFGASAFEPGELAPDCCATTSGRSLAGLLHHPSTPVRIAALDAYLTRVRPHAGAGAEAVTLPGGVPEERAQARDTAVAELLDIPEGARVALIGVVNPLVAAIRLRGGIPLPCDLNLRSTQWNDPVSEDMTTVLPHADVVVATGMTLSNGTFDRLLEHCRSHGTPLIGYAQTGAAVVRAFLAAGVTALSAEPFPFSQCSADSTALYRYRSPATGCVTVQGAP